MMICNVRLLKSQIETHSFLEDIITAGNEVFNNFESDIVVGIGELDSPTWETDESNIIIKQTVGF